MRSPIRRRGCSCRGWPWRPGRGGGVWCPVRDLFVFCVLGSGGGVVLAGGLRGDRGGGARVVTPFGGTGGGAGFRGGFGRGGGRVRGLLNVRRRSPRGSGAGAAAAGGRRGPTSDRRGALRRHRR